MQLRRSLPLTYLAILCPPALAPGAGTELSTNRPDATESPWAVPPGEI